MTQKKDPYRFNGLLPVSKPEGMFSKDVSRILQKKFGKLKLGHVGTLDPMASGVLPIVLGKATRLQDYLLDSEKVYDVEISFGFQTDSLDITGEVVKRTNPESFPDAAKAVEPVLASFLGQIYQTPPLFSAVKYKGKPLYAYARENASAEVPLEALKRSVKIFAVDLLEKRIKSDKLFGLNIRVVCSKGTYIRVLVNDICEKLQTVGTMKGLRRIKTAGVSLSQCVDIRDIEIDAELLQSNLIGMADMPVNMCKLTVDQAAEKKLFHGRTVNFTIEQYNGTVVKSRTITPDSVSSSQSKQVLILNEGQDAIGIGECEKLDDLKRADGELVLRKKRGL